MNRYQAPHLVTHSIKVTEMVCPECERIIAEALTVLDGVVNVTSNWRRNTARVNYDLNLTRFQDLEELLNDIGYAPDTRFFHSVKRGWIRFTEQNEIDNMKHVAHCCSKPPVGA